MCTRLFILFVTATLTFLVNVAVAANIVHGVKVVVIDAGHGGNDPGAHYAGVYEKELVLKVALRLGALIEEQMPGVKVVYTRKSDKALSPIKAEDLQARADIANKAGGDLFISIHANAAKSSAARGVETLIMGESSKEQIYNESALFENNREDLIDMSDERTAAIVRAYIQNLQFTYGEYSMAMARCIQKNYEKAGRHSRGVKPQLLRVLYATDMPGVLTEIGFMSNPQEMAVLKSEKGRDAIVRSLLAAVMEYSAYLLGVRGDEEPTAMDTTSKRVETVAVATVPVESDSSRQKSLAKQTKASTPESTAKPSSKAPVRYAVQVMASTKVMSLNASQFKSYRGKVKQFSADGRFRYKYCVGEYNDAQAAQRRMKEVRKVFPEAFVVRCQGAKIVK